MLSRAAYLLVLLLPISTLFAQDPSAIADFESTDKGLLVPRMTETQKSSISSPAKGLLIYQTNGAEGFYYNIGTSGSPDWFRLGTEAVMEDSDADTRLQLEETPDDDIFRIDVAGNEKLRVKENAAGNVMIEVLDGSNNTFVGDSAGYSNTSGGAYNTFYGAKSGLNNTSGYSNSFFGVGSGFSNLEGNFNSFFGLNTGRANTSGNYNSFYGVNAGSDNETGHENSFFGHKSGLKNKIGGQNSFFGTEAGENNVSASHNSFFGFKAGENNTTGSDNSFFGANVANSNTTGNNNSFFGNHAGSDNTTGGNNCFFGESTGTSNTTGFANSYFGVNAGNNVKAGSDNSIYGFYAGAGLFANPDTMFCNTFIGSKAGYYNEADNNTFVGDSSGYENTTGTLNAFLGKNSGVSTTSGSSNTFIGENAGSSNTTGSGNTMIGQSAGNREPDHLNCTMIGLNADVAFMVGNVTNSTALGNGATIFSDNEVIIGNDAVTQIGGYASWSDYSDVRYKQNIREDIPGLKFIQELRPVTYNVDAHGLANHLRSGEGPDNEKNVIANEAMKEARDKKSSIRYTGFVAQEVEAAADELGYDFSAVKEPSGERGLYKLSYSKFVVPLVKAVQQQQEEIDEQNKEISSLKNKNEELESRLEQLESRMNTMAEN